MAYVPVAHWVFAPDGWISAHLGALDHAGGTVVEVDCGARGLAPALVLGPRPGFRKEVMRPHNLPLVLLGGGLLWFGRFGCNAGSALVADGRATAPRPTTTRPRSRAGPARPPSPEAVCPQVARCGTPPPVAPP